VPGDILVVHPADEVNVNTLTGEPAGKVCSRSTGLKFYLRLGICVWSDCSLWFHQDVIDDIANHQNLWH
jgi:hypothetical protein